MNRRVVVVLLLFVFAPLLYCVYIASSLIALLFEDGLTDSVTLAAIEAHANSSSVSHPIPKIIHQTWKNNNIPEQWQIAQFTWYAPYFSIRQIIYLLVAVVQTCIRTITTWYNRFLV
jgi:hypothetical protein